MFVRGRDCRDKRKFLRDHGGLWLAHSVVFGQEQGIELVNSTTAQPKNAHPKAAAAPKAITSLHIALSSEWEGYSRWTALTCDRRHNSNDHQTVTITVHRAAHFRLDADDQPLPLPEVQGASVHEPSPHGLAFDVQI